jgi:hypothetical protein
LSGGLRPGLLQITGPSKHFKSAFTLLIASAYLQKYPEGAVLFYDSEFGTNESYFNSFDLPMDRCIHSPITNIEEFKHDLMFQLNGLNRGDKVIIIVDSIGNLASKKEVDDAIEGHSAADMTRAKALKSLGRMITPLLTLKDIPMVAINHVYKEIGGNPKYAKNIVGGGTGMYLASDNIWILGRRQSGKDDEGDIAGYDFVINIEKSRYAREKTQIPITVNFSEGLNKWSGLFDLAMSAGLIHSPSKAWYSVRGDFGGLSEDKKFRRGDIEVDDDFWKKAITHPAFIKFLEDSYKLGGSGRLLKWRQEEVEDDDTA